MRSNHDKILTEQCMICPTFYRRNLFKINTFQRPLFIHILQVMTDGLVKMCYLRSIHAELAFSCTGCLSQTFDEIYIIQWLN